MSDQSSRSLLALLATGGAIVFAVFLAPGAWIRSTGTVVASIPTLPGWLYYPAIVALVVAFVAAAVYFVVDRLRNRSRARPEQTVQRQKTLRVVLILAAAFLIFYLLMATVLSFVRISDQTQQETNQANEEILSRPEENDQQASPPYREEEYLTDEEIAAAAERRNRILALVITIVVAAVSVAVARRLVRRVKGEPVQASVEDAQRLSRELLRATRMSLQRLVETGDDRVAVIAAYGLVEDAFSEHGFTREPSQTPRSFVKTTLKASGVLDDASGRPALEELAGMFEVAKFSDHPIGADHRARAVRLFERIEHELTESSS